MPETPGAVRPTVKVRRPMVCEACNDDQHQNCANPQACVCAFRGHQ